MTMLLTATFGMSQTIIVKDSITHEAVPFVSVYFGNDTGGYTDEKGMIAIPNEAAQIRLSHICYETKSISKIPADSQTIFLVPKSIKGSQTNKDHRSGIDESEDADQAQRSQWI